MTKIQLRRDTAANWSTNNPTPASGEPCFETDTGKLKIGDGVTAYNNLPYQGGSSAPTNMVTTDTAQDITAHKTFYGEIRVGADNNYATLATLSKEDIQAGNSTIGEHIDLGPATIMVRGSLGKEVYDTGKYVFKKYINVDDLSDDAIEWDNSISSQVAHMAMPSNKYIDLALGASGSFYTAPADGYFILSKVSNGTNQYITMGVGDLQITNYCPESGNWLQIVTPPVQKGQSCYVSYNLGGTTNFLDFIIQSVQNRTIKKSDLS